MPRYEIYDDGVANFWTITLTGHSYALRWGRVPGQGAGQVKEFDSETKARADYHRQISAKLKKGYRLVAGTEEPEAVARVVSSVDVAAQRNPQLEAEAAIDPNDEGPLLVLGDWLQSQGDPRGELLSLQYAQRRETDPARFVSMKRAVELHYAAHEPAILGPVFPFRHLMKLEWHLGFVRAARISYETGRADDLSVTQLLETLIGLPASVVLQELALGALAEGDRYPPVLEALCRRGEPKALRTLLLGDLRPARRSQRGAVLGDLRPLGAAFPLLRRLVLAAGTATYGDLELPRLRTFEHLADLDERALDWLAQTRLAELELLNVTAHLGQHFALLPLLEAKRVPRLRQFRLIDTIGTAALLEALAVHPVLPQLELLDLDDGDLEDDGATWLTKHWTSFAHLKTFRLGKQHLSSSSVRKLRNLRIEVRDPGYVRS